MGEYCIKYPVAPKDRVKYHCKVVPVSAFISTYIAEKTFRGVGLKEGPIHEKIPYRYENVSRWTRRTEKALTGIDGVYCCKCDEDSKVFPGSVNAIDTECDIVQYRCEIFAAINKMRKYVSSILVTTNALQCTPNSRKCREEPKKPRMCRVTLRRIIPMMCIQAEK